MGVEQPQLGVIDIRLGGQDGEGTGHTQSPIVYTSGDAAKREYLHVESYRRPLDRRVTASWI